MAKKSVTSKRAKTGRLQQPSEELAASLPVSEGLQARIDRANRLLIQQKEQQQQPAAPPRYVRSGPPVQMQDVLLACGELNERERVAVRWVLDKINELPEHTKEQGAEPVAWMTEDGEVFSYQHPLATTPLYRANTRAVSIDKIMDEVMGWCCATKDAEEDLRERLMKMAALP